MSIRLSDRTRSDRGFALITALLIAVLYLSLIEIALRDATETIRQAHRVRSRIASQILAENAIELAAENMFLAPGGSVNLEDELGTMSGKYQSLPGNRFEIRGEGVSAGVMPAESSVVLRGRIQGSIVRIEESETD